MPQYSCAAFKSPNSSEYRSSILVLKTLYVKMRKHLVAHAMQAAVVLHSNRI